MLVFFVFANLCQVAQTSSGPAYRKIMGVLAGFMGSLDLSGLGPNAAWIELVGGGGADSQSSSSPPSTSHHPARHSATSGSTKGNRGVRTPARGQVFALAPIVGFSATAPARAQFAAFVTGAGPGSICRVKPSAAPLASAAGAASAASVASVASAAATADGGPTGKGKDPLASACATAQVDVVDPSTGNVLSTQNLPDTTVWVDVKLPDYLWGKGGAALKVTCTGPG
jgi:hypothetical protein